MDQWDTEIECEIRWLKNWKEISEESDDQVMRERREWNAMAGGGMESKGHKTLESAMYPYWSHTILHSVF